MESATDRVVQRIREEAVKHGLKETDSLRIQNRPQTFHVVWRRGDDWSEVFLNKAYMKERIYFSQMIGLAMAELGRRFATA